MNWNADREPDLTDARAPEEKQIPVTVFQHLVESLPRRVKAVTAVKRRINADGFEMLTSTRVYNVHASTYFGHVV